MSTDPCEKQKELSDEIDKAAQLVDLAKIEVDLAETHHENTAAATLTLVEAIKTEITVMTELDLHVLKHDC